MMIADVDESCSYIRSAIHYSIDRKICILLVLSAGVSLPCQGITETRDLRVVAVDWLGG